MTTGRQWGEARWLDSPTGSWMAGIRVGLAALGKEPVLALKRLVLPVSYWRSVEFAYACGRLRLPVGSRVLDLGSPKDLPAHLARYRGHSVTAVDILADTVALSDRLALAQGIAGDGPGLVRSEVQDGRHLPYRDGEFDAAVSVSVLEHIPDDGDSLAMRELVRIVRPGGRIVVTVPFAERYFETFRSSRVYERDQADGAPVFYERHYDDAALASRLTSVPGTRVLDLRFLAFRGINLDEALGKRPRLRTVLSPMEPLLGAVCIQEVPGPATAPRRAACFTLEVS